MADGAARDADRDYTLSQGLACPALATRAPLIAALLFQPRVVGVWFIAGWALQSPWTIFALAATLWWCALVPSLNLFDAIYRSLPGGSGRVRLGPAPAPRRFSQGMAGTFVGAQGIALAAHAAVASIVIGVLFCITVAFVTLGKFCVGSFIYRLLGGRMPQAS
jgi:hypothetical protein